MTKREKQMFWAGLMFGFSFGYMFGAALLIWARGVPLEHLR